MILLIIVTFGIYVPVWLYLTRRDLVKALGNPKAVPPFWYLLAPILLLVILAVLLLAFSGADSTNVSPAVNIIMFLGGTAAIISTIVIPLWWFYRYFQAVHNTSGYTDHVLLYIIWILCIIVVPFPIWMLLVQNDINKTVLRGAADQQTPPTSHIPDPPYPANPANPLR